MPSDPGLSARVLDKLNKVAAGKDDAWKLLVLAALEGEPNPGALARAWRGGAPLGAGGRTAQIRGKEGREAAALGWHEPLRSYRPCLSYNELGSMLDEGPSKLYDGLAAILGLEDLVTSQDRLREARLQREKAYKAAAEMQAKIVAALRATFADDHRAREVVAALDGKDWDLDKGERGLAGSTGQGQGQSAAGTLPRRAAPRAPAARERARATDRLR